MKDAGHALMGNNLKPATKNLTPTEPESVFISYLYKFWPSPTDFTFENRTFI